MTIATLSNQAIKRLTNNEIDFAALKIMLLSGATFDPTQTTMAHLTGNEVSGNGWPAGGPTLTGVNNAVVNTTNSRIDANNVVVTATGGDIGPADAAILYDATNSFPILYIDFEIAVTSAVGTNWAFYWNSGGILQYRQT